MIPFGVSFGDFVAGVALLKSLIDALDGTFGAKAEYRGLIAELYCLERALVAIKEIEVRENSSEFDATQQAVRGCRECIDRFILKIASYQSLTAGKSSIRDQVRKIIWSQCRKEDLHKFKEDLSVYVSTINVLLNTLQLSYSKQANLTTLASVDVQTNVLREINDTVKNSDSSHNEILQRMERLLQNLQPQQAPIAPNFASRKQIMPGMDGCLLPLSTGSTFQDEFSQDFKIEIWKWKKFDICSETIVDAAPMAKEVHLYSSGNTAVLRSWACRSGLPKLSELQQLEINIYPRYANDEEDCRQYIPELRKKLADRCRRLEIGKINVKYLDSHAAPGGSDGEDQEKNRKDDNNLANATLKSSEWIVKLRPFVDFIANVSEKKPSVRVALLDDGVNVKNLDGVQEGWSFRPDKVSYFVGPCSHGTEMARCIRAICPMAELYIARLDDSRKRDPAAFTIASAYEALKWAISMEVDIISMSWTFRMKVNEMDDDKEKFIREIRDITSSVGSKRPILFGSFPDKRPAFDALEYAPVGLPGVIGIASETICSEPSKDNWEDTQKNPKFLLPGKELEISAGYLVSGSSFSTAYASGLAALVLYCLRAHKDLEDDDLDDERHKRLKTAETSDGMTRIFRNLTQNPADNSYQNHSHQRSPLVRPNIILGNRNFELSEQAKQITMQEIVTQLLPINQCWSLPALS